MHWLTKLPAIFAALAALAAAASAWAALGGRVFWAALCLVLACAGELAACFIGIRGDQFSEAGLRLFKCLSALTAILAVGAILVLL